MNPSAVAAPDVEFYRAPIDGSRCLRSAGRLRRLRLPLPADPPPAEPAAGCFLCHPERDRFDRGPWPREGGALRVLGNAHPFAERTLLVAPAGETHHRATPASLAPDLLAELLRLPFDEQFLAAHELADHAVAAFVNVGRRAAQSKGHPHLQLVGFRQERGPLDASDAAAIGADLAAATSEARRLPLGDSGTAVVPRQPALTGEAWLELPEATATAAAWRPAAIAAARLAGACARGWSGDYNLVLRLSAPRLLRVLPRGISERAGLEFAAPALLASVVAATVRESVLLWQAALEAGSGAE